jgi:hypothetical protein
MVFSIKAANSESDPRSRQIKFSSKVSSTVLRLLPPSLMMLSWTMNVGDEDDDEQWVVEEVLEHVDLVVLQLTGVDLVEDL